MHDGYWFHFGLGHWGWGLLVWGGILFVLYTIIKGNKKDD